MKLDWERIRKEADANVVVSYLGIAVEEQKKGRYLTIRCPAHERVLGTRDEHIGNCVVYRDGCYCHACRTFLNPVELVKEVTGCGWEEAYRTVADAMGGAGYYEKEDDDGSIILPKPYVSEEEALVLEMPRTMSIRIDKDRPVFDGLSVLYQRNPDKYRTIIAERAQAVLNKLEAVKLNQKMAYPDGTMKGVLEEVERRMAICRQVITRFAS